jgi:2,4-dienoyl-CoA reductase-like NADH-dependent reductase (Old Yellow Enzyme family)
MRADQKIDTGPGYQTGFAAAVKAEVSMAVVAVGEISEPLQAETILRTGQADAVALARPMLFVQRRSSVRTSPIRANTNVATRHAGARRG